MVDEWMHRYYIVYASVFRTKLLLVPAMLNEGTWLKRSRVIVTAGASSPVTNSHFDAQRSQKEPASNRLCSGWSGTDRTCMGADCVQEL